MYRELTLDQSHIALHWYKKNFPHILGNSERSGAKSCWPPHLWWKYLCISSDIRKPFLIYYFAPDPIWISKYMRKILFSFLSVYRSLISFQNDPACHMNFHYLQGLVLNWFVSVGTAIFFLPFLLPPPEKCNPDHRVRKGWGISLVVLFVRPRWRLYLYRMRQNG